MISSKDRSELKKIISSQSPVYQVGKEGLNENNIEGIKDCLIARELIKINILQNCDDDAKTIANNLANLLECEIIGVIGRKVILYKVNKERKTHVLKI